MLERKQQITTRQGKAALEDLEENSHYRRASRIRTSQAKLGTNWSLSGARIDDGINVMGSVRLCGCGTELSPYQNQCSNCEGNN